MKNLSNFGIQNLDIEEMKRTDGGFFIEVAIGLTVAVGAYLIVSAIEYPKDFSDGLFRR